MGGRSVVSFILKHIRSNQIKSDQIKRVQKVSIRQGASTPPPPSAPKSFIKPLLLLYYYYINTIYTTTEANSKIRTKYHGHEYPKQPKSHEKMKKDTRYGHIPKNIDLDISIIPAYLDFSKLTLVSNMNLLAKGRPPAVAARLHPVTPPLHSLYSVAFDPPGG